MKKPFGCLPDGSNVSLYTITNGNITAAITDLGATLVSLWVPDKNGNIADIILGFKDAMGYHTRTNGDFGTIGRNANRIKNAEFSLGDTLVKLVANDNGNSLHSKPAGWDYRVWEGTQETEDAVTFYLHSPDGDQGFPGNADVHVTFKLEDADTLSITYHAVSDQDTLFNMTNHTHFNMAGHQHTDKAMDQILTIPGDIFTPADAQSIPTGEERSVAGTPMDFRTGKPIGQDIEADYEPLKLQFGYDHNFVAAQPYCAILEDPVSGRKMSMSTTAPGFHFYCGNYTENLAGKEDMIYDRRSGVCLEPQFYPDSVHKPQWKKPFFKANEPYICITKFKFN